MTCKEHIFNAMKNLMSKSTFFIFVAFILLIIFIFICDDIAVNTTEVKSPSVSQELVNNEKMIQELIKNDSLIKPYTITEVDDTGRFTGRSQLIIHITADKAKTLDEKLATAAVAAKQQLSKHQVNVVGIMLDGNTGGINDAVVIDYLPDKKYASGISAGVTYVITFIPLDNWEN